MSSGYKFLCLWVFLFGVLFAAFNGIIVFVNWAPINYPSWEPAGRLFYALAVLLELIASAAIALDLTVKD